MDRVVKYAQLFAIYSFIGWVYEVFLWAKDYHMYVNRGFCLGPWLPVYGVGGILILFLFGKKEWNPVIRLLIIAAFAAGVELIATYVLDLLGINFHSLWNYDDDPLNFQGRIAAWPAIKFGIIATVVLFLQPKIEKLIERKWISDAILFLCVLFAVDIIAHLIVGSNYRLSF